ncbi:hypothetical protein [Tepidibacter hydrothermalis]|uniref:Uncharacterized protein n=1 Tax=Tepidibacter hydrothermalis TaxID=3036126 RepID=A0ABY8EA63_9FIRM|nr:hypothetical protein [Tepidibacter hydrothermalis]WFD09789.1 hypothetical protein P4S50_15530 [Tepidibacter hydrothermalis]
MTIKSRKLQLTKHQLDLDEFLNGLKEKPYVMYPKEYSEYMGLGITAIFLSSIPLIISLLELKKSYSTGLMSDGFYFGILITIMAYSLFWSYIINIIGLITRRIKIELGENYVKFRGTIRTRTIYINDIKSITEKHVYRHQKMTNVHIKRRKDYSNKSNRIIRFQAWWFDEKDMRKLFQHINTYNKRTKTEKLIDVQGINIRDFNGKFFQNNMFIYDEIHNTYICPNKKKLIPTSSKTTTGKQIYSSIDYICAGCQLKEKCLKPNKTVRVIVKRD